MRDSIKLLNFLLHNSIYDHVYLEGLKTRNQTFKGDRITSVIIVDGHFKGNQN